MDKEGDIGSKSAKVAPKSYKKSIYIALIILILGVGGYFAYSFFYTAKECGDYRCYTESLDNCRKVWFTRESDKYVWRYEILNSMDKFTCNVDVRLLKIKEGASRAEKLEGQNMVCQIKKTTTLLPEEDMLICTGPLRERLQEVIIDRMHNYLLENLEQVREEFKGI